MAGKRAVQIWKRGVPDHAAVRLVLHHDHHDVGRGAWAWRRSGGAVVGRDRRGRARWRVVGGRAELAVMGGPLVIEVVGGAVTGGAVDVAGTDVSAEYWDGVGTSGLVVSAGRGCNVQRSEYHGERQERDVESRRYHGWLAADGCGVERGGVRPFPVRCCAPSGQVSHGLVWLSLLRGRDVDDRRAWRGSRWSGRRPTVGRRRGRLLVPLIPVTIASRRSPAKLPACGPISGGHSAPERLSWTCQAPWDAGPFHSAGQGQRLASCRMSRAEPCVELLVTQLQTD